MHRAIRAKILYAGDDAPLDDVHRLIDQLGHAFVLRGRDGHDRHTELPAHELDVDRTAVVAHLVHHVERNHHRDAQFQQLERQVQVSLDIRRVYDVDDAVGFAVEDEVARDDLLLRVWPNGVDTRQVNDACVLNPSDFPRLLLHRHARKVSDMLIGPRKRIEQRRLS